MERSLSGRWGRRVLCLGLAAQHFNDVVKIHRSIDLVWLGFITPGDRVVVHGKDSAETGDVASCVAAELGDG
jgi:hypothetical protein